jgi:hypothetical protein
MNTFLYGVFVSPHGGVGGPPSFFGLLIHQRHGNRAVGSGGFCLTPVIIPWLKIVLQITNCIFHLRMARRGRNM